MKKITIVWIPLRFKKQSRAVAYEIDYLSPVVCVVRRERKQQTASAGRRDAAIDAPMTESILLLYLRHSASHSPSPTTTTLSANPFAVSRPPTHRL